METEIQGNREGARMNLPQLVGVDADDIRAAAQGLAYAVIAAALLVGVAGAVGLAWTVFRLAGGLA